MFDRKVWSRLTVVVVMTVGLTSYAVPPGQAAGPDDRSVYLPVIKRPADFDEFWQTSLSRLAQWPMQVQVRGERLAYRGIDGKVCTGVYHVPTRCQVSEAVIHIMDHGDMAQRTPRGDGFAHLGLYWYPPRTTQPWTPAGLPDRAGYLLQEAIVDACQAVNALLSRPEIVSDKVGITGEGVGGLVAMAVAALDPERVSFVVADRPWPVYHYHQPGPNGPTPQVAAALAQMEARYPHWRLAIRAATTYFDMPSFAAGVKAPVLMLDDDDTVPTEPGEPGLMRREVNITSPTSPPPATWEQTWQEWAIEANQRSAEQITASSGPAAGATPGAIAGLVSSTDKLFVTAEPVSLSWLPR